MLEEEKQINGIDIRVISAEKYTRNLITVNFILPLSEKNSFFALLTGVLRSGCEDFPDRIALNSYLDSMYGATCGGSVSKVGENQILSFYVSYVSDRFTLNGESLSGPMMDFLYKILRHPLIENNGFRADYVEIEKKNLVDRIHSRINQKPSYAHHRCLEEMCSTELFSYDELGIPDVIETVTSQDLYKTYQELLSSSRVLLIGSGEITENMLDDFSHRLFPENRCCIRHDTLFVEAAEDISELSEEMEINQSVLCLGFRTGAKHYSDHRFAYQMLNVLYGASATSYLFMNVREKLHLCYFCTSVLNSHKGILSVISGIEKDKKEEAYKEIMFQLERLKQGDISEADMTSARKMIENSVRTANDGLSSSDRYLLSGYIGGCEMTPEAYLEEISKVSKDDIVQVANAMSLDTVYFLKGVQQEKEGEQE